MKWISVEDSTPDDEQTVIVYVDNGDSKYVESYFWSSKYYLKNNITHWMPLPNPPTLENTNAY